MSLPAKPAVTIAGRRFSGIIFDVEGTIVNVEEAHWRSWQKIIKDHTGLDFPLFDKSRNINEYVLEFLSIKIPHFVGGGGNRIPEEIEQIQREFKKSIIVDATEIRRQKEYYYKKFLAVLDISMRSGFAEFQYFLREMGIPICLGSTTNPEDLSFLLENSSLGKLFKHSEVFTPGLEDHHGQITREKPHPDIFNMAAYTMGFEDNEHSRVLVIGDSTGSDGAAANAGGFGFLGMPTVYNEGVVAKFEGTGAVFVARDWMQMTEAVPEYKEWLMQRQQEGGRQTTENHDAPSGAVRYDV